MSGQQGESTDKNRTIRLLAFMGFAGWTFALGCVWLLWMVSIVQTSPAPELRTEAETTAQGCAVIMATGCLGSVYLGGLLPLLVLYLILRR